MQKLTLPRSQFDASQLPLLRLLPLSFVGFLVIMNENTTAGLLALISPSLHVSVSLAGQLSTAYALGSVIAAIPIVAATRRLDRLPLLIATVVILAIFNAMTAFSSYYILTLLAQFIVGMAAGVAWALLPGYAQKMSPKEKQGKAMTIVLIGEPIALCLGMPLANWLGSAFSWRGVFEAISLIAITLIILIYICIPNFPGQTKNNQQNLWQVLQFPGITTILGVIFTTVFAHNLLYTYITAFLLSHGLPVHSISIGLFIFGISALIGISLLSYFLDKNIKFTLLGYTALFIISGIVLNWAELSMVILGGIAVWGFSFGGIPTILVTSIVKAGKEEADLATSMMVTIFNFAIASGAFMGGVLLNIITIKEFPLLLAMIGFIALVTVILSKRGFPTAQE